MRDIKFRCWDKACQCYVDGAWTLHFNGGLMGVSIESVWSTKDVIVEQYTGLKDLNGMEIYEGDLIENERGRICKVVWHEYAACFDARHVSDKEKNRHIDRSRGFENSNWNFCIQVIGNIHENHELLEVE